MYISAVLEVERLLHGIREEEKGDKGAADILIRAFFIVPIWVYRATVFVQRGSITGSECTFDPRQVPAHRCRSQNSSCPPLRQNYTRWHMIII